MLYPNVCKCELRRAPADRGCGDGLPHRCARYCFLHTSARTSARSPDPAATALPRTPYLRRSTLRVLEPKRRTHASTLAMLSETRMAGPAVVRTDRRSRAVVECS